MSSGERKRIMAKPGPRDTLRGLRPGGSGSVVPGPEPRGGVTKRRVGRTGLEAWPERVMAPWAKARRLRMRFPE